MSIATKPALFHGNALSYELRLYRPFDCKLEVEIEYSIPPGCDVSFRVTKIERVLLPLNNEFNKFVEAHQQPWYSWPSELLEFAQLEAEFNEQEIVKACLRDRREQE